MDQALISIDNAELATLQAELTALRTAIQEAATPFLATLGQAGEDSPLANLAHYLALRHHDLRPLQRRLMRLGLSSLGRLESRVLPTLEAVLASLTAMQGIPPALPHPTEARFFAGEKALTAATANLFGPPRSHRRCRIMVTLPSEAAGDAGMIRELARAGMDSARINCAHDDAAAWHAMAAHVRAASVDVGRPITILMDVAGPKIRTGRLIASPEKGKLRAGDSLWLTVEGAPPPPGDAYAVTVSLPEIVNRVAVGDRVLYDDGKLEGLVEAVQEGAALVRVGRVKEGGLKPKPEKGLNLPDTALGLSPLTAKDERDLAAVIECADMIGYSFVSRPEDIDLLEAALARLPARATPLGLVAKIERPDAVRNLPDLIARAGRGRPFGVMIARGDLAAEIGFERLAEMQEEILWICEAASVPVIWATQVLEDLVKSGVPSRGEMTDAAMAARAECVMLNKGPAVATAVSLLDRLLGSMDGHLLKKTPVLRPLKSW
jgi:pyruvate kinase